MSVNTITNLIARTSGLKIVKCVIFAYKQKLCHRTWPMPPKALWHRTYRMSKWQSKTVENSPVKIEVWKSTKSNNSKSMMPRVMVLVHCTSPQWDISTYEDGVYALHSLKVKLRTKFKNENEQRAITPKVCSFELWFTALLLNETYLPMTFQVSSLNTFRVMLRTKKFINEN